MNELRVAQLQSMLAMPHQKLSGLDDAGLMSSTAGHLAHHQHLCRAEQLCMGRLRGRLAHQLRGTLKRHSVTH